MGPLASSGGPSPLLHSVGFSVGATPVARP